MYFDIELDADVNASGPLFDGRAVAEMAIATDHIRDELADRAIRLVSINFAGSIRENHGVFMSQITAIRNTHFFLYGGARSRKTYVMPIVVEDPAVETVVTTENAMYGPWLEGTGSRNLTTRFKGYFGYRRAAQQLDDEAEIIAEEVLEPYIEAINEE